MLSKFNTSKILSNVRSIKGVLIDFLLAVKAATLIFISVVRLFHMLNKGNQVLFITIISCLGRANVRAFHENLNRIHTELTFIKVHFRHLAVNFLPQYFITLLFSLTCFLTISRKKRPKSGPKNPLLERFLYFVNYLRPSNNSRASFTVFSDSSGYSYELLLDLL